jgi:hypothetical protein
MFSFSLTQLSQSPLLFKGSMGCWDFIIDGSNSVVRWLPYVALSSSVTVTLMLSASVSSVHAT